MTFWIESDRAENFFYQADSRTMVFFQSFLYLTSLFIISEMVSIKKTSLPGSWTDHLTIVSETTVTGHHSSPLKVLGPGGNSESIITIVYSINFNHHDTTNRNEQITLKYYIILQEFGFKIFLGWNPQINNWIGTTKTYQTWFPANWCILRHTSGF